MSLKLDYRVLVFDNEPLDFKDLTVGELFILRESLNDHKRQGRSSTRPVISIKLSETTYRHLTGVDTLHTEKEPSEYAKLMEYNSYYRVEICY